MIHVMIHMCGDPNIHDSCLQTTVRVYTVSTASSRAMRLCSTCPHSCPTLQTTGEIHFSTFIKSKRVFLDDRYPQSLWLCMISVTMQCVRMSPFPGINPHYRPLLLSSHQPLDVPRVPHVPDPIRSISVPLERGARWSHSTNLRAV